jgi:predicted metal-dependent hydrolase
MVLHELCHLKMKEHSHRYWDSVRKFMPNYEEKSNGWRLMVPKSGESLKLSFDNTISTIFKVTI